MDVKGKNTTQRTQYKSVVVEVFEELKSLRKNSSREKVVETIGRLGSIARREPNGDTILHLLGREEIKVTEIATDVALREYEAYPEVINSRRESPLIVAGAANNIPFLKKMKEYNLRTDRPLSQMDPARPYEVKFKREII